MHFVSDFESVSVGEPWTLVPIESGFALAHTTSFPLNLCPPKIGYIIQRVGCLDHGLPHTWIVRPEV